MMEGVRERTIEERLEMIALEVETLRRDIAKRKEKVDPMQYRPWSSLEKDILSDALDDLVTKRAVQFGRSKLSIAWALYRLLRPQLGLER